jgi:hypothetical protein
VCFSALAKDRNQRQPDAIAFGRDLQNALSAAAGYTPRSQTARSPRQKPVKWILLASGVLVILIVVIGAGIAIKFGMDRFGSDPSEATNQTVNQNSSTISSATTASSTEDLRGTWAGTYGPLGYATKLIIKNQNGDQLKGTLEQGTIRVAFNGTYDSTSRVLTMKQTEVLSGEGWSLGEDSGKLSADGKKINGTGKDALGGALGMSYEWSFTRK